MEESNAPKMEIIHPEEKKVEKKEQMSIDDEKPTPCALRNREVNIGRKKPFKFT